MDATVYSKIVEKLEDDLSELTENGYNVYHHAEQAIGICIIAYQDLEKIIIKNGFHNPADEIYFFKKVKPQVCSKLTFYRRLAKIETRRPKYVKAQTEYLQKEIHKLHGFFEEHSNFIEYYRSNQTLHDDTYFRRNINAMILGNHNYDYLINPDFSTAYDFILSQIIAYEQLEKYLDNELRKLEMESQIISDEKSLYEPKNKLTIDLNDFAELIYALIEGNAVNHGKIKVKQLVDLFRKILIVPKGNIYSAFREVHSRKKKQIIFIEELHNALKRKIDDANK